MELRQTAEPEGLQIEAMKLDLLDEIDWDHALTHDIDVLFNNAGVAHRGNLTDLPIRCDTA